MLNHDASIFATFINYKASTQIDKGDIDGAIETMMDKYKDPIHIELEETAKKVGGHGGMDFIMDYRLAYCLQNGLPLDMDVYDLAEWCCMAELTRLSIENNSAPVEVPDFTRGGLNKVQGDRHEMCIRDRRTNTSRPIINS